MHRFQIYLIHFGIELLKDILLSMSTQIYCIWTIINRYTISYSDFPYYIERQY